MQKAKCKLAVLRVVVANLESGALKHFGSDEATLDKNSDPMSEVFCSGLSKFDLLRVVLLHLIVLHCQSVSKKAVEVSELCRVLFVSFKEPQHSLRTLIEDSCARLHCDAFWKHFSDVLVCEGWKTMQLKRRRELAIIQVILAHGLLALVVLEVLNHLLEFIGFYGRRFSFELRLRDTSGELASRYKHKVRLFAVPILAVVLIVVHDNCVGD